jgi:two-component system sensor histidine kinase QseC
MGDRTSRWSLRGRLVWISALALTASLLFGGLAMFWAATIEENQMLDSRLEHLGAIILSFVEEELEEEMREVIDGTHTLPLQMKTRPSATLLYRYQVWTRHGNLVLRSHEASMTTPLMPLPRFGYDTIRIDGEEYRTFGLPTRNGEMIVQVAENNEERWAQTATVTLYYVGFLLIPFGLVLAATWWMFAHSLLSIDSMADQLRDRTSHDLTPVQVDKPPRELLPILKAVDNFFARMTDALSVEPVCGPMPSWRQRPKHRKTCLKHWAL